MIILDFFHFFNRQVKFMVHIINLLCGIGVFLFGISIMSDSVEAAFGDKLKNLLATLTKTRLSSVLTGTFTTGAIQSSAATTVMTVSFVDSCMMTTAQAAGVVMGANIGTTVTSLLIAFNFSAISPLFIFFGALMKLFCLSKTRQSIGMLSVGFGLLFLGMNTMSGSFAHLKDNPAFLSMVAASEGKLGGIIAGFIMTAVMQSSSATVGILQALAQQGIVSIDSAVYIVFGQNIGAVVPTLLSVAGKNNAAKSVGVLHLLFNIAGTIIFSILILFVPVPDLLRKIPTPEMQVSVAHILFNVASTVIMLPFTDLMVKLCERITGVKQTKRYNSRQSGRK